jgi:hypothetical protein
LGLQKQEDKSWQETIFEEIITKNFLKLKKAAYKLKEHCLNQNKVNTKKIIPNGKIFIA